VSSTRKERFDEHHAHPSDLIGSIILGLNDGIVTSLVFVLSIAAASGSHRTTIIAGFSEMLAGGVAMCLGGYTAARATREAYEYQVDVERHEIQVEPEEERAEVKAMYHERGFRGTLLDDIVHHVTSDPERWLKVMVRDELGASPDEASPSWLVGLSIGLAFVLGAFVPLLSFVVGISETRVVSIVISVLALVATGALRSRYSRKSWWQSVSEMVIIGGLGAGAGVIIGAILSAIGQ
jgi:VIT1/CCC1 family predicted Fe2+/Mn2+ transporter